MNKKFRRISALAIAVGSAFCSSAAFSGSRDLPNQNEIDVQVNASFVLPMKDGNSVQTAESGRASAYSAAAKECETLLSTIASTCRMVRINVNSADRRNYGGSSAGELGVQINYSAAYRIVQKAKQ